jgi:hypothetical protein
MIDAGELHLPICNSRYLPTGLTGSPCFTASALVLYAKRPFGGPKQVLSYLANCTHRVALSNRRSLAVDAQHQSVTFTYRDYRHGSQRKDLTLSALEFIRRFSLHILPPGLVRIRHYGILGNNRRRPDIEAAHAIFKRRGCAVDLQPQSVVNPRLESAALNEALGQAERHAGIIRPFTRLQAERPATDHRDERIGCTWRVEFERGAERVTARQTQESASIRIA